MHIGISGVGDGPDSIDSKKKQKQDDMRLYISEYMDTQYYTNT